MIWDRLASIFKKPGIIGLTVFSAYLLSISFALFFVSQENYFYFWDDVTYQNTYHVLASTLRTEGIGPALQEAAITMTGAYNFIPAALPAVTPFLPLHRLSYIGLNTFYYFVPWLLLTSYYLSSIGTYPQRTRRNIFIFCCVFLGFMPLAWKPLLAGMPDIGSVALASVVLILYQRRRDRHTQLVHFTMGVLLVAMVVFRRYFAFWAVGFFTAMVIDQLLMRSVSWKKRFQEMLLTGAGALFALALAGKSFIQMLTVNYGQALSRLSFSYPLYDFLHNILFVSFGVPIILVSCMGTATLVHNKDTRQITLFLLAQSFVSTWLFTRVQSFAIHHFLLLLPFISYVLVHGTLYLYQRIQTTGYRRLLIGTLIGFQLFSFIVAFVPNTFHESSAFDSIWPLYYPPQQRGDMASISSICQNLISRSPTVYVLSSSGTLNNAILGTACPQAQILDTPEVDGRDAFPTFFFSADIVVVATPIQIHLEPEDQVIVGLLYERFFSSELQQYYRLVQKYPLDKGVTAQLYVRTQPVPLPISTQIESEYKSMKQLTN